MPILGILKKADDKGIDEVYAKFLNSEQSQKEPKWTLSD